MTKFVVEQQPIKNYYLKDSKTYFDLPDNAYTFSIFKNRINDMNESGLNLYQDIILFYENNKHNIGPRNRIMELSFYPINTGSWFADETSPHYKERTHNASLNTFNDFNIMCTVETGEYLKTSRVIVYVPDKVVITATGSVYDLSLCKIE